jgi:hypothetical protein
MKTYLVLAVVTACLSACATVEEERRALLPASEYEVCHAASDLRTGAENKRKAANQVIASRGIRCDWQLYAQVHAAEQQSRAVASAALATQGAALLAAGQPRPAPIVTCSTFGGITTCR